MSFIDDSIKNKLDRVNLPPVDAAWASFSSEAMAIAKPWWKGFMGLKVLVALLSITSISLFGILQSGNSPIVLNEKKGPLINIRSSFLKQDASILDSSNSTPLTNISIQSFSSPYQTEKPAVIHTKLHTKASLKSTNNLHPELGSKKIYNIGEPISKYCKHLDSGHLSSSMFLPKTLKKRTYSFCVRGSTVLIPSMQNSYAKSQWGLGVLLSKNLNENVSISAGAGVQTYAIRPLSVNQIKSSLIDSFTHFKLRYINIPLLFNYQANQRVQLSFGPQIGFLQASSNIFHVDQGQIIGQENEVLETGKEFRGLSLTDFSITASVTYSFGRAFAGVQYQQGLKDYTKSTTTGVPSAYSTINAVLFTAGYNIFK